MALQGNSYSGGGNRGHIESHLLQAGDQPAKAEVENWLLPLRAVARVAPSATNTATFSICVRYNGKEQSSELPLTPAMVGQLALEASARDQKISDLAKDLIQAVTKKDLIDEILKE